MGASAVMIGGQIIQGVGAYQSGLDKAAAYRTEAGAKRAQAAQVEISANYEIEQTRRRYELTRGAALSAFGRSGVQVNTGSPLMEMEEMAAVAYDEMQAIRHAANYRKSSILTEGMLSEYSANSAERAGEYAAIGAGFEAFSKNPYMYDTRSKNGRNTGGYNDGTGADFSGIA